jgi:chromate transport protein ChrA
MSPEHAEMRVINAIGKGLLKVLSKMGISTIQSYRGAQIFEAIGLDSDLVDEHFTGTPSRLGGIGLEELALEALVRHARAYPEAHGLPVAGHVEEARLPEAGPRRDAYVAGVGADGFHLLDALAAAGAPEGAAALPAVAWTALKVGALSYGGGFVIIPLMQGDAVERYGWMTPTQFVDAVAFGQLTPGPVTHTVALVGWAAAGLGGALLASVIAFAPSFAIVGLGGERFGRLRRSLAARAFLDGAGPAAVGAITGAAIPLLDGLEEPWQLGVLAVAAVVLALRPAPLLALATGGAAGLAVAVAGGPLP